MPSYTTTAVLAGLTLATLGAAFISKPGQDAHERAAAALFDRVGSQQLKRGAFLGWLAVKGANVVRNGRFEMGMLTSTYEIDVLGQEVARCTGVLGTVWCVPVNPS